MSEATIKNLIERCEALYLDLNFGSVRKWKEENPGKKAMGFMPIYVPRELIHAAGMLPVGVVGGGDQLEIIKGDAYFQSYICHIPRSTIELGLNNSLDCLDGMLFPSICDVIRNMSGMWKLLFPDKYSKYFDLPQNFDSAVGGEFYRRELDIVKSDFEEIAGVTITTEMLNESIVVYNENRKLVEQLYAHRSSKPWEVPTEEVYLLLRAGFVIPVEDHNEMLTAYLANVGNINRKELDNSRVVITGTFCEQPPLGLIRSLERAGCYIVEDDLLQGARWIKEQIAQSDDPVETLANAFLNLSSFAPSKYEPEVKKGQYLVDACNEHAAEGVIFCAPSFCDPALLDQPMLTKALDDASVNYTNFKYSEDTGQFGVIREQAGTFADSIKLWSTV